MSGWISRQKKRLQRAFFPYRLLSPEQYRQILSINNKRNRSCVNFVSLFGAVIFLIYFLAGVLAPAVTFQGNTIFLTCAFFLLLISVLNQEVGDSRITGYLTMTVLFLYGIRCAQPDQVAVTIIVLLVALPLMISDEPWRMYLFVYGFMIGFLLYSFHLSGQKIFLANLSKVFIYTTLGMIVYTQLTAGTAAQYFEQKRIEKLQSSLLTGLSTVIENRDAFTGGHIVRTGSYIRLLAEGMREDPRCSRLMTEEFATDVVNAAPLHDIGKIRIPDQILNKPGRLTDEEFAEMKRHSVYGAQMVDSIFSDVQEPEFYQTAYNLTRWHHERYDGKGYPDGLKGLDIPLEARMMAVCDVYDALVSKRCYKEAFSVEKARRIIAEGAGTQFDPIIAQIFLRVIGTQQSRQVVREAAAQGNH